MVTLVSGGAGSGKSEYAEGLAVSSLARNRVYVATMEPLGEEGARRVARHRALRAGKGFLTLEAPRELERLSLPPDSVVLLECLSNLAANECFGPEGFDGALERMLSGVGHLEKEATDLIIVTNELFSDGVDYGPETMRYLSVLGRANRQLAAAAGRVVEVVCGIPVVWKGASL